MVGRAGFDGTVRFPVAHFSDTDNIRVETECRHKQLCLRNVICLVIRRAGDGMHHIVDNLPCSVPLDKRQFSCARFNGIDTLIIRNPGKQSVEQRGFTAAVPPDDCNFFRISYFKIDVMQNLFIGKRDCSMADLI